MYACVCVCVFARAFYDIQICAHANGSKARVQGEGVNKPGGKGEGKNKGAAYGGRSATPGAAIASALSPVAAPWLALHPRLPWAPGRGGRPCGPPLQAGESPRCAAAALCCGSRTRTRPCEAWGAPWPARSRISFSARTSTCSSAAAPGESASARMVEIQWASASGTPCANLRTLPPLSERPAL